MKVIVQYEWEFSRREWKELAKFHEGMKDDPKIVWRSKMEFDCIDTFYHMNQLVEPKAKLITFEK